MGEEKIIVLGLSPTAMYVGRESYVANIKCLAYDFKKGPGYHSKYFEKTTIFSEALFLDKLKKELLNNGTTIMSVQQAMNGFYLLLKIKIFL